MTNLLTLDQITRSVQVQFGPGVPNGWLLSWDINRCFDAIKAAAAPHKTWNLTSFDYTFCNWFEIRICRDESISFWTLTLKLSFISPVLCLHWTQYDSPIEGHVIAKAPDGYQLLENRVLETAENAGFIVIPDDWLEREIPGVELELSGTEHVTLSKCLFCDFEG